MTDLTDQLHEAPENLPARLPAGPALRASAQGHRRRQGTLVATLAVAVVALLVAGNLGEDAVERLLPTTETPADQSTATPRPPALPTTYPTDSQRQTMVSLDALGPEHRGSRQVGMYPTRPRPRRFWPGSVGCWPPALSAVAGSGPVAVPAKSSGSRARSVSGTSP